MEYPKHVGGGWMVTSDGEKHRGREAAEAHQALLDAETDADLAADRTWRGQRRHRIAQKAAANRAAEAEAEPVTVTQVKVQAAGLARWARGQWQSRGMAEALRFNRDGAAWLTVERNGEPIEVGFVGPSGAYREPVAEVVSRHPDFEVTGETRTLEVTA